MLNLQMTTDKLCAFIGKLSKRRAKNHIFYVHDINYCDKNVRLGRLINHVNVREKHANTIICPS